MKKRVLNKKGVALGFLGIMLGFLFLVMIVAISPAVQQQVAAASTNLDCSSGTLSAAQTGVCILVDWTFFMFVATGLSVAFGYFFVKRLLNGNSGGQ